MGRGPWPPCVPSSPVDTAESNGPLSGCASGFATAGADGQWYCSDANGNPMPPSGPTNPDGSCQSGYVTEVQGPNGLTSVCAFAPSDTSGPPEASTQGGPPEAGTQDWAVNCPYGYGNNPNGAGCYCGPGQTPYLVGANPYCIPPPVDANGNPVYPANASCANGWDPTAQACVCGPGDAPMSVVGPSGVDCVEPAGATYSTGPHAVPYKSGPPDPADPPPDLGPWVGAYLGSRGSTTVTVIPNGGGLAQFSVTLVARYTGPLKDVTFDLDWVNQDLGIEGGWEPGGAGQTNSTGSPWVYSSERSPQFAAGPGAVEATAFGDATLRVSGFFNLTCDFVGSSGPQQVP